MSQKFTAMTFTVLLIVAGVGGVMAFAPSQGASATTQQASCDYQQVFDRTIDSVVSIQTDTGQGSGFVVDVGDNMDADRTDGNATNATSANASYVVTNAHVVGSASEVTLQFTEGEYRIGEVVGQTSYADLAVIRVDELPAYAEPLTVADDDPQEGQKVAALGHPFGLEETITKGIVSGVNRSIPTDRGFAIPNILQTDAAINPGNSGGPLVTCDGIVVGVNTAGIPSARADNIGFAVSASVLNQVVPELVAAGEFDYPFLGIATRPVTPAVVEANDLSETRGLIVVSMVDDGPAGEALQESDRIVGVNGTAVPVGGDVILAIDGQTVRNGEDLASYLVTQTDPGDTVELTILRDGERRTVNVNVGERPEPGST
jgi:S1-C subfamily serine protease